MKNSNSEITQKVRFYVCIFFRVLYHNKNNIDPNIKFGYHIGVSDV